MHQVIVILTKSSDIPVLSSLFLLHLILIVPKNGLHVYLGTNLSATSAQASLPCVGTCWDGGPSVTVLLPRLLLYAQWTAALWSVRCVLGGGGGDEGTVCCFL